MTTPEKEACTLDGAVDRHGRPAIRDKTGTWVAGILILGTLSSDHTMHDGVHNFILCILYLMPRDYIWIFMLV